MNKLLGLLAVLLMLGTATVSAMEMYPGIDGKDVGWKSASERGQATCFDKLTKRNIGVSTHPIDQERFLNCLRNSDQTPEVKKALAFWANDDMRAFARYVSGRGSPLPRTSTQEGVATVATYQSVCPVQVHI